MKKPRIAIIVSHPIQHFCPMYASWASNSEWKIKVFFASSTGVKSYFDKGFNKEINWKRLYLDKFDHEFLNDGQVIKVTKDLDATELERKLIEYNPDMVIVYGYTQKVQLRAKRWAKLNNKKAVMIADAELRHRRPWYVNALKYFIIPKKLSGFDGFLTTGDANEEYYHHYGVEKQKFFRSPFPIDIFIYEQAIKERDLLRRKIRIKYNINDNDIVLTNVGKFVKWKRQIDILKSLKELENKNIVNIFLFLIGSGEEENYLRTEANILVHNKVIYTGFINPEELPAYYAASDIYVHPATREPHSLAISEAIYMGCPIIISNTCGSYGPTDDVRENQNGFVFKVTNVSDLKEKIEILSNDQMLRNTFSENSKKIGATNQNFAHKFGFKNFIDITYNNKIDK